MLVKNLRILLLALSLLSSFAVAEVDVVDAFGDTYDEVMFRNLQDGEPLWWDRISTEFDGINLQKCTKKSEAPDNGSRCSRAKTCFFGTQDCDGIGAHPETKCFCDGKDGSRTWQCKVETCPAYSHSSTSCPADGGDIDHGNDSSCPIEVQYGGTCSVQNDVECIYGTEKCCGECHSSYVSRCDSGSWISQATDACMHPSCMFEKTSWPELAGKTCFEARAEIFKVYPGMTVVCLKDTDPMPEADDFNRYIVVTDANDLVINAFFNRIV